jgi:hypothetical protein
MASSGERRLLFDTRGKRKHVIRVVYAVLALLMGASLFLVIGPINIGELIGNSTSGSSASEVIDEQVERIERRVAKNPSDEQLLLALTRARISAGNAKSEVVSESALPVVTPEARDDFEAAAETWNRYVKQAGDEPSATGAQLMAGTFIRMAEANVSLSDAVENFGNAVRAQRIAAEQRPNINSLSTLAIYQYFNSEFAAGDKTAKQAAATVSSKSEANTIEKQLDEFRKRGKKFDQQKKQIAKAQKETGKEQLQSPLGGLDGVTGGSLGE